MIGVDRLLYYGPGWVQKYRINFTDSGEGIVQDATLIASNLVVDGINNAYAGFQKRNPLSPELKEDIKNVKNILGGSALFVSGLALVGIILQNQKFNLPKIEYNPRPKKKVKKN